MVATSSTPLQQIFHLAADAWRPTEKPPTPDWCEQNIWMPSATSADPGPFDLRSRPYWREPLAMCDDPDVLTISIMGGSQDGKTALAIAALISRAALDPAPAMLAGPDQDAMREARDKVYATCEASANLAKKIPPRRLWNDRWIDLKTCFCYLAYSGSAQRLRGRTCKFVVCTEVDVWQDSPRVGQSARIIRARVKAFSEYKILFESAPTDDASTIAALIKQSDQRKYQVPCPHCGHYQELRFFPHKAGKYAGCGGIAGMQVDPSTSSGQAGNWLTPDEARQSAYYICEQGCRIDSADKPDMVARGRWVPRGCHVDGNGKLRGKPDRPPRNVGYQISSLYAETNTFGVVAAQYLEHREAGALREFWNNWLGLPFSSGGAAVHWKTLGRRLAWTHRRGTVPAEAWFLTAAADVQSDRVYFIVRGWGDRCTSWLIDWGCLQRAKDDGRGASGPNTSGGVLIASDLAQLDAEVLDARWPVAGGNGQTNPRGLTSLQARVLGIDAGHRITDVFEYVRAHAGDRVRALHGDHKVDPQLPYRVNVVEKNARTGKPYPGGLQLWGIYVNAYKEDLTQRFACEPDQPGAWRLPADIFDGGTDYLRQIVNESKVTEVSPSGKPIVRWVTRDRGLGEHYWDCEVYARCLADMVIGGDWDAATWTRPAPAADKKKPAKRDSESHAAREYLDDFSAR